MNTEDRIKNIIIEIHKLEKNCYPEYSFKIGFLTIFTQSNEDYEFLINEFEKKGVKSKTTHGIKFTLTKSLELMNENIESLRVRQPDVHRKELGCCDLMFDENEYGKLREIALDKGFDIIVRKEYEMIELSTLDIDCYAYILIDY